MIHHISLEANNPKHVATVLAEIIGGQAIIAPPNFPLGSQFVLSGDQHGTMFEVMPRGTDLRPDESEVGFHQAATPRSTYSGAHAYISVNATCEKITAIGAREGWLTRRCNRGPFELMECWVENQLMLELAPPPMLDQYLNFLTNPEMMQAALAGLLVTEAALSQ